MSGQSEANKRLAKNTIFLSIRMIIVLCINLYTTRATLKAIGIDDYGIYNIVCGFVSMFTFLNTSMANGIQRFFNYELGKNGVEGAKKVYVTSLLVQALLLIIIISLTETFGLWYLYNKMIIPANRFVAALWIFQLSILSFVFIILQIPYNAAIMAHEKMGFYALIGLLDAVLKLLIVLIIPQFYCDRLILYGVLLTVISLLDFLLAFCYAKKKFEEIKIKPLFDTKLFKSILSFSGWNLFGSFSCMIREQGLNIILNLFFGPVVNAARGVAYQVASGLQGFVANAGVAIRPQIIQSYAQGNITRTINLMLSLSKIGIVVLFIMSYPILLEIEFVLKLWLGENVPNHTASFVLIVVLISYLNSLNYAISSIVHATGKMRDYQIVTSIIPLMSLPIAYYMMALGYRPEFVFWVSFVFLLIMLVASLIMLKYIIPEFTLKRYMKEVLIPLMFVIIVSIPVPLFLYYSLESGWWSFIVIVFVSITISSMASYMIALNQKEKLLVRSIISKFIPRI